MCIVENIKVSIIMPVYNSGKYLKTAVESILNQSLREIELILVDDGSTDESAECCDEWAQKDNRVKVIHQKNGGICAARNAGIKIASGEYIGFSDHDDEYLPGLLETAYGGTDSGTIDVVKYFKQNPFIKDEKIIGYQKQYICSFKYVGDEITDNIFKLLDSGTLVCVWDGIYKRSLVLKNNILFDPHFKSGGEDYDFNIRLIRYIHTIRAIDKVLYIHNLRIGYSTSSKFNKANILSKRYFIKKAYDSLSSFVYNLDQNKDYAYFVFKNYICPVVNLISNPLNMDSIKEKKSEIDNLNKDEGVPSSLFEISTFRMFFLSKKIGLAYFLYKNKYYKILMLIFNLRKKERK